MLRKKFAVLAIIFAATFSIGGSPVTGFNLAKEEAGVIVASSSMSESTSLLIFGSGLWALAMLRRQRREPSGV
jgi:hypothetical protein